MRVYITKYALTTGIIVAEARVVETVLDGTMIHAQDRGYFYLPDWHVTAESALQRCEEMRARKLKSIERQHKKLSETIFIVPLT